MILFKTKSDYKQFLQKNISLATNKENSVKIIQREELASQLFILRNYFDNKKGKKSLNDLENSSILDERAEAWAYRVMLSDT